MDVACKIIVVKLAQAPVLFHRQPGELVGGRAGNDAVKVVGVALGRHQGLATAGGATIEVVVAGRSALVSGNDGLSDQTGQVDGTVAVVNFGDPVVKKHGAVIGSRVAGVGDRRGIAIGQKRPRRRQCAAGITAVAQHHKAPVPIGLRDIGGEADAGAWLGAQNALHATDLRPRSQGHGFSGRDGDAVGRHVLRQGLTGDWIGSPAAEAPTDEHRGGKRGKSHWFHRGLR